MIMKEDTQRTEFKTDHYQARQQSHESFGACWVELRDARGKLQGKWDPVGGVLEIQQRGVKTRYWLVTGERSIS